MTPSFPRYQDGCTCIDVLQPNRLTYSFSNQADATRFGKQLALWMLEKKLQLLPVPFYSKKTDIWGQEHVWFEVQVIFPQNSDVRAAHIFSKTVGALGPKPAKENELSVPDPQPDHLEQ